MTITVGIDPHKASHTGVAIDEQDRRITDRRLSACGCGTRMM